MRINSYKPSTINHKLLFKKAKRYIPGGVNSPVRSFKSVGGVPLFVEKAEGARIYDEEGNNYIDYCMSFGPLILGHSHPVVIDALKKATDKGTSFGTSTTNEIELAKLIVEAISSIDKVRLTNSGTEAVMTAVRLARAYTKRKKIIKFEGSYHGHADYLLVRAGSGNASFGMPDSKGVPQDFTRHTLLCQYNDTEAVSRIAQKHKGDIAAILVEPVMANCGVILPEGNFLRDLRELASEQNIVLIFDEVITGFRLIYGSAQEYFNVEADLTCLGKIIGGGLPVGAVGGKNEIMELLSPEGDVYQAGTLSGNPLATTAGIATLNVLKKKNPYAELGKKTESLSKRIRSMAENHRIKIKINNIASLFSFFFFKNDENVEHKIKDYNHAEKQSVDVFAKFFHLLLDEGIYLSPSCFESNFLSTAHIYNHIHRTLEAVNKVFEHF